MTNGFFSNNGNRFIVTTSDQIMLYKSYDQTKWDLSYKKVLEMIDRDIYDVDLNPDGEKQLAVTCQSGRSYLVDLENSRNRTVDMRLGNSDFGQMNRLGSIKYQGNGKELVAGSSFG